MRERFKSPLALLGMLALMLVLFSPILFTGKIVRAPDILNEFYWGIVDLYGRPLASMLRIDLSGADWNLYINSGHSNNGGMAAQQFNLLQRLIFGLIPAPASVAWFMVLQLFLGGAGLYAYCRLVGCSRAASLLGGLVFALSPENVTLINAGHVMKLATIAHAPWVFFFLEKGLRSERLFFYLCAGMALTFQFFSTHWQIAYYTCLAVGLYVIIRLAAGLYAGESLRATGRSFALSLVMTLFFLCAVSISLAPLASWSRDTNRGVQSGANQGKGGLQREEAMMWSLPPEESVALLAPGLFGLSRQEGGDRPAPGHTYYWGRMFFTQTASYFGLLPWLLLPLPLLFRNDRITKAALIAVLGGLLFAMGKYTPFYQLLYDYLPGISRFRVPKMILFLTAMGLGVLAARGLDLLREEELWRDSRFRSWRYGIMVLPLALLLLLGIEKLFGPQLRSLLWELLAAPTRYEAGGAQLATQRWLNIERETGLALFWSCLTVLAIHTLLKAGRAAQLLPWLLIVLFTADVWRVNQPFLVLTDLPDKAKATATPVMEWLRRAQPSGADGDRLPLYRVLPLGDDDPMSYAAARVPVLFTANAVQKRRWQEFLDQLALGSRLPDMVNLRWLVLSEAQYRQDRVHLEGRYQQVFNAAGQVVLENRQALPKAWLVGQVELLPDPVQRLKRMQQPDFDPARSALVEVAPGVPLTTVTAGDTAQVMRYEGSRVALQVTSAGNRLLVLGEKYHEGWQATVNDKPAEIVPVNHILRGVYLPAGSHQVEFRFDPLPFKIGKWITLSSFALFAAVALREWWLRRRGHAESV